MGKTVAFAFILAGISQLKAREKKYSVKNDPKISFILIETLNYLDVFKF